RPLLVDGRTVHQVGLPWHWGYRGLVTGDVANDLTAMSEDPNARIMEAKALLCDIAPSAVRPRALAPPAEKRRAARLGGAPQGGANCDEEERSWHPQLTPPFRASTRRRIPM